MPLTLATCHAEWDDYLDLTETVTEMAHRLMKEDSQEVATPPKAGTTPKKKEAAKDNPVHLSDATDTSASGSCPQKDDDFDDEAKL